MWGNLNDSAENVTGGFLNDSTSFTGGNKGNVKRVQNIVPVMIGLLNITHGDLKIFRNPVHIITLIGIVRHIEKSGTKETYKIEDETGTITAFRWLEAEKSSTSSLYGLNTYVQVYGHLREQNSINHVLILRMRPITDFNELTTHLLEVTYVMLKSKKMASMSQENTNTMETDDDTANSNISGLTKEQIIVLKAIQAENDSDNGIHRSMLTKRVPKHILSRIDSIIDFLTSEGHIYTTLDDDHLKTT